MSLYSVHMTRLGHDEFLPSITRLAEDSSAAAAVYMCACRPRAPMGDYHTLVFKQEEGGGLSAVVGIVSVVEGGIEIPNAWWSDSQPTAQTAKRRRTAPKRKPKGPPDAV